METIRDVIKSLLPENLAETVKDEVVSLALTRIDAVFTSNTRLTQIEGAKKCVEDILFAVSIEEKKGSKPDVLVEAVGNVVGRLKNRQEKKDFTKDI
jgi:hypothetical protein